MFCQASAILKTCECLENTENHRQRKRQCQNFFLYHYANFKWSNEVCVCVEGVGDMPHPSPKMPAFPLQGNETKILDTAHFWWVEIIWKICKALIGKNVAICRSFWLDSNHRGQKDVTMVAYGGEERAQVGSLCWMTFLGLHLCIYKMSRLWIT